jgi:hypothetical protein
MRFKIVMFVILVLFFVSCVSSWAVTNEQSTTPTKISLSNSVTLEPLLKGSGGGKSSGVKVKSDSEDGSADGVSGDMPWWVWLIIVVVILVVAGVLIWYFFIR